MAELYGNRLSHVPIGRCAFATMQMSIKTQTPVIVLFMFRKYSKIPVSNGQLYNIVSCYEYSFL